MMLFPQILDSRLPNGQRFRRKHRRNQGRALARAKLQP
jgi:hypothetical protein